MAPDDFADDVTQFDADFDLQPGGELRGMVDGLTMQADATARYRALCEMALDCTINIPDGMTLLILAGHIMKDEEVFEATRPAPGSVRAKDTLTVLRTWTTQQKHALRNRLRKKGLMPK